MFASTTLAAAVGRLGFVQADPIQAPARAQDLILRHRVRGYRAGDLDGSYRRLRLEENFLYAYGFMPGGTRRAWCKDQGCGRTNPARIWDQATRT